MINSIYNRKAERYTMENDVPFGLPVIVVIQSPQRGVIQSPKGEESPDGVRESVASFFLTMYLHRELLSV